MSRGKRTYGDCTDKRCLKGPMCRQAAWGQYSIICLGLADPYFEDGVCKFYKTKKQYAEEYRETNKLKNDPYLQGGEARRGKKILRRHSQE